MKSLAYRLRTLPDEPKLPDGVYQGVWGGYHVRFAVHDVTYECQTTLGIRTPNTPCTVTIANGQITVETV